MIRVTLPNGASFRSHTMERVSHKKIQGTGMGSVLLDGGMGHTSSYASPELYERTVNPPQQNLASIISSLSKIKPKKNNIKFNM